MEPEVVVIGAGISGLAAARRLQDLGRRVQVVEKARGVGGRMSTRRVGDATFDHGAQFFTTRHDRFRSLVHDAEVAGAVTTWTHGFGDPPDGHPRWRGVDAMTALCKWMAADASIAVETATTVVDLSDFAAPAFVLTAPVPQSLAVLSFSRLLPDPVLADALATIRYRPTIAVMAVLDGTPSRLPPAGAVQLLEHRDLAFVCDNRVKGVSAVPALTVHFANDRSAQLWSASDEVVVEQAAELTAQWRGRAAFTTTQVHRWRYAGPVEVWPEPTVVWGEDPVVALAGEAFAGPKVEGAFLSGEAAAEAVHLRLS